MTDQTMTPEQALEWLEGLRNTTGDQVCAEIEAGKAAEAAQAFRAALEAAREDAAEAKQNGYELGLLAAAREDADKLRETLRTVSAVGIVQLFGTARDDVLAEFSLAELQEISRVTEHKRPERVERIYREGWDAAIDQARGEGVAE